MKKLFGMIAVCAMLCAGVCSVSADETEPAVTTETAAETTAAETTVDEKTTDAETTGSESVLTTGSEESGKKVEILLSVSSKGELAVANKSLAVYDMDKDDLITINDALMLAHKEFYKDKLDGYKTEETQYGPSIVKLWGVEQGYNYGYYLNNEMVMTGLTTEIKNDDTLYAFSYKDAEHCSDMYTYFDTKGLGGKAGDTYTLTLKGVSFDANFQPVAGPVAGASITVDGEKIDAVTDENGKAAFKLPKSGIHQISAVMDDKILVPPVANISEEPDAINMTVTISSEGELVVTRKELKVEDINSDCEITIYDALYAAHKEFYDGKDGFATEPTQYGESVVKLWGVANGCYGYGYYVNDIPANGLSDPVKADDYLVAFSYKDLNKFSDQYTFFSVVNEDKEVYQLNGVTFDENFKPVAVPVKDAAILLDGKKTKIVTDEKGQFVLPDAEEGTYILSASSDSQTLVPPAAQLKIVKEAEKITTKSAGTSSNSVTNTTAKTTTTTKAADTKTTGPDTGDRTVTGIAITGLTALAAAIVLRKRRDA
ncbi:MAG: hypothetical protein IK130_04330 [Oscillospiraceae bacterium]|nr:hypothetical protein [Oscillospiraceae bacterium]